MHQPLTHTDESIEHWGRRFVSSGLVEHMSFEQFMELPPAMRERRWHLALEVQRIRSRVSCSLPSDCRQHDKVRTQPIRRRRWPWFFRRR